MTTPAVTSTDTLSHDATRAALVDGAVIRWWQATAFVEVAGPDAPTLLDGLCTQAVERIAPGTARLGLFLDAKAKVVAPAVLHRTEDAAWEDPRGTSDEAAAPRLLLETLPQLVQPLLSHLTRFRLRSRATLAAVDVSSIALVGDGAALPAVDAHGSWTELRDAPRPTWTFLGDAEACSRLVREQLPVLGHGAADPDALEADRIEAGVADLHDLLPGRMPAEVGGMARAVALDAGCYLGQEPVARLHYRGRANRTLRRLQLDGELQPRSGDPEDALALRRVDDPVDARPVGRLTTWARRGDGATVALAVLRRELAPGDRLLLAGVDEPQLGVVDDPPS